MIRFHCKNCNHEVSTPEIHAGKKGKCPKCKSIIIIPNLENHNSNKPPANPVNTNPSPEKLGFDLTLLDTTQDQAQKQAVDKQKILDSLRALKQELGDEKAAPTPVRKLPWLIDIFLYPTSNAGLTIMGIIIGIPLLINIIVGLAGAFGFFILVFGLVINTIIGFYAYWYFCECIRDSADGNLRAPDVMVNSPSLGDMFFQTLKIIICTILFFLPMLAYYINTKNLDWIFFSLLGFAVLLFPMTLLAIIMFNSISALNPILIIQSIFNTFIPYLMLTLVCFGYGWFLSIIISLLKNHPNVRYFFGWINLYMLLVVAHLFGRFYWKYREKLNWDV